MKEEQLSDLWHYAVRKHLSEHEWTWTQSEQEEMAVGLLFLLGERKEYARLRKCENRQTSEQITRAREAEKARELAEARVEALEKEVRRLMREKKHDQG